MRLFLATFAVATSALPSIAPAADRKDEDAIQGSWKVEKFDAGEDKAPAEALQLVFTFKDGKFSRSKDGVPGRTADFKLDPTTKPKSIDIIEGKDISPGIYELDGDTLKLTIAVLKKAARPTEFTAKNRQAVITLKRVKEEKKDK